MIGIVAWAVARARMVLTAIVLSITAGTAAYVGLPKEGSPDIEIPALYVSVPFPGISAEDSESLLVKPMETRLADIDGLESMSGTAAEGYAGMALEFDYGWDKAATVADVRDAMNEAQADFPEGAEQFTITEINVSEFPIVIVNLTGTVPERTMTRIAKDLQDRLEALDAVLEAGLAGKRDEMVEVIIDPLQLESYNLTAAELDFLVRSNNQLIAAGEIESEQGAFAVKIPSSFDSVDDIYRLPIKTNGDRIIRLGDLAKINFTFEDRQGTARFNGVTTVALQVVKQKGFNIIDTVQLIERTIEASRSSWPPALRAAVTVGISNDQSRSVASMVSQLEGAVLTAIALVMIVVLSALGTRAAMLVGFAIPTSFLLCFVLLALMGVAISNIVMFGLILSVGMLVDGAIVVVEYADKRIREGTGPRHAYIEAAQRMFWPIVTSTATTLCAFLPMLFWPGMPGEFMGMLPVTLIFVLSASLIVTLVFLPVMGGVSGRISRSLGRMANLLREGLPWFARVPLVPLCWASMFIGAMQILNPAYLSGTDGLPGMVGSALGGLVFVLSTIGASITMNAARPGAGSERSSPVRQRRGLFGAAMLLIAGNPIMPVVTIGAVIFGVVTTYSVFQANNLGVEYFVDSEPEQVTAYVRARGNLSVTEKDVMVRQVEDVIRAHPAVVNVFSFAGSGGLDSGSGEMGPPDTVGQVQFELLPWEDRPRVNEPILGGLLSKTITAPEYDADTVLAELTDDLIEFPGFITEMIPFARGPSSSKPVHLRITGNNRETLIAATKTARAKFDSTAGLTKIEDTLPLPGIDWQIDVDVEKAGRFGADVATVGAMVQLVTRGILLDTMRSDGTDEEIDIRLRLPEEYRALSTLDSLKIRTADGLVPLSNFVTRRPVEKLEKISRIDQKRYFDVKADVMEDLFGLRDDTGGTLAYLRTLSAREAPSSRALTGPDGRSYALVELDMAPDTGIVRDALGTGARLAPINPTERIQHLTAWLDSGPFTPDVEWEWSGDQEEQNESGAFLSRAFAGALFLMFIILLTQFNSFYNSVLVLLAVILSTTGVLIGMLTMQQPFSIVMTGTGVVALAGIVVNNNIVLIDTYQEFAKRMPPVEAIVRTAEARIRPVLLTSITTMAGLAPMMFGLSLDFIGGGYSIDSPTSLWWKQLATAVVFGLGTATLLTLVVTPSFLALRVWGRIYVAWFTRLTAILLGGRSSRAARDARLERNARRTELPEIIWEPDTDTMVPANQDNVLPREVFGSRRELRAAE